MNELISVIVPIYNAENTIIPTINSIRAQDYVNLEILLIDDGSIDKSLEICLSLEKQDRRIKAFPIRNSGPALARQYGLDRAKGKYVAFCDSDDIMESNMLSTLYSLIEQNDSQISICAYDHGNNLHTKKTNYIYQMNQQDAICKCLNEISVGGFLWNKMFVREMITKYNIRFDETVFFCEDLEFVIDYILHCEKIVCTSDILYHYIYQTNSLSSNNLSWLALTNLFARKKILTKMAEAGLEEATRFAKKELVTQSIYAGRKLEKADSLELQKKLTESQLKIIIKEIKENCLRYGGSVILHRDCSVKNIVKFIKFYLKCPFIKSEYKKRKLKEQKNRRQSGNKETIND